MEKDKFLENILQALNNKDLRMALEAVGNEAATHPALADSSRLDRVRGNYELMLDYWSNGYDDPHLQTVIHGLTKDVYAIAANMALRRRLASAPLLATMRRRAEAAGRDWSPSALKQMLEAYVQDVAMTQLEPPHTGATKRRQIQASHKADMSLLFDHLATSAQWEASTVEPMLDLLLSPTVDIIDQQLIVTGITMSSISIFDPNKFKLLATLYMRSTDEAVKQRALVGWAMTLGNKSCLYDEIRDTISLLLNNDDTLRQLVELQIQIIYCVNAEADTRTIQEKIMPDLMRNGGLNITQGGIYESDADPEDLLHPEEAERRMEQLEQSINRMADMQKAGSDVYFGSFAQMKRFAFFGDMSNWFVPFHMEHPDIAQAIARPEDAKLLENILHHVPLCDSDKYSFVLAFEHVAQRLPQHLREMLSGNAMVPPEMAAPEDTHQPAFVRRIYLQNLYRFYRCFPQRSQLHDPFVHEPYGTSHLFFTNKLFQGSRLQPMFSQVIACLLKRKMNREAVELFENYSLNNDDLQYYVMMGWFLLNHPNEIIINGLDNISQCFAKALEISPDDNTALLGYARAMFKEQHYEEAADVYAGLLDKHPDNAMYQLNMCACRVNEGKCADTLPALYKLSYEHPQDQRVQRVMARALMGSGQHDKAAKIYGQLTSADTPLGEDLLNAGLCQWLMRNRKEAARLLARFLSNKADHSQYDDYQWQFILSVAEPEEGLLAQNGIGNDEIKLMADLTYDTSFQQ